MRLVTIDNLREDSHRLLIELLVQQQRKTGRSDSTRLV
jgi:hypothetical protein